MGWLYSRARFVFYERRVVERAIESTNCLSLGHTPCPCRNPRFSDCRLGELPQSFRGQQIQPQNIDLMLRSGLPVVNKNVPPLVPALEKEGAFL